MDNEDMNKITDEEIKQIALKHFRSSRFNELFRTEWKGGKLMPELSIEFLSFIREIIEVAKAK